jgi:uncharacterized membrane protein YhhN
MKQNLILTLFFIVATLEIIGEVIELRTFVLFFKPLLMPFLLVWYIVSSRVGNKTIQKSMIAALIFSFLGDTLLLFVAQNEIYFLLGLGAFLIAQLSYAYAFNNDRLKNKLASSYSYFIFIIFSIYILLLFLNIYDNLKDFAVPVAVYALAVSIMGVTAALRLNSVNNKSYRLTFIGAVLFVLSDTVIAIDKFSYNGLLPFASVMIMSLYIIGQYLIVKGMIKK